MVQVKKLLIIQSSSTSRRFLSLLEVKVQVKLSLCLTMHHAMKAYGGVEV
jgi:hypothetical protein